MGWLDRFPGRKPAAGPETLARVTPGDRVEAAGETWNVTAVLFYRDASSEWPVVKIERGTDGAWLALEDGQTVRYDHLDASDQVQMKVGLSFTGAEGARRNVDAELSGWDFDAVKATSQATWNRMLGRIDVAGGTHQQ